MRLDKMKQGDRFQVTAIPEYRGEVLHVGESGVRIRREGSDKKNVIRDKLDGSVKASFTTPGEPYVISGGTEVSRL